MRTTRIHHARREERGAAVYIALFVLIPIAALTFALVQTGISFTREHTKGSEDDRSLMIAEAGLAESYEWFSSGGSGVVGTAVDPAYFGDGLLWTEVEQVANRLFLLKSSAMYESGRAAVEQFAFRFSSSLFDAAIFSSVNLTIGSQTLIDSFDSTLGTYASQVSGGFAGDGAVVQSNGDVTVGSSAEIHGDIYPGEDDSVTVPGSAEVTGSQQPLPETITLSTVTAPTIPLTGSLTVSSSLTLPAGNYHYSNVTVNTGKTWTITGPAKVVMSGWSVLANSSVVFNNVAGPIEVYVTGNTNWASNSTIVTTSQTAVGLQIYFIGGPTQLADLRSNSNFYGAIYCPQGTVRVRSNFKVYGAVVANNVLIDANARIHYDEALQGLSSGYTYHASSWMRTDFENAAFLADRRDPFMLLGLDPALLDSPQEARL